ncbi:DUF192 domain-containing protein [Candidatus Saccharibacteria bacterium]|nr:DUF192 domain-containing protein [Candidatus Saccharibacteria bacterium]
MHKEMNRWFIIGVVFAIVATIVIYVIMPNLPQSVTSLRLGDGVFRAKLALNESSRQKGLGGTSNLPEDQALLMAFTTDDKWGIWMKDMSFPIDIIWLNSSKKVVYIVKNVSPDDQTKVYEPRTDARYVIELPAGTVDRKAISADSLASFSFDETGVK